MGQQHEHLDRVTSRIGGLVLAFVRLRWSRGEPCFHMRDLHDYIFQATQIAPASPDRILRQLRQAGQFDYRVLDRRASFYEITRGEPRKVQRELSGF